MQSPVENHELKSKVRRASLTSLVEGLYVTPYGHCRSIEYVGVRSKVCPGRMVFEKDPKDGRIKRVPSTASFRYAPGTLVKFDRANGDRGYGIIESYHEGCCFTYVITLESGAKLYTPENFVSPDLEAVEISIHRPVKKRMSMRVIYK